MSFSPTTLIHVFYIRGTQELFMGKLALKERKIFFEYALEFLKTGLELSPFKLPLKPGILLCEERAFEGLFGIFNDSLPDGWGRLLLDRKLARSRIDPFSLSPLDRLRFVGEQGMGALVYKPAIDSSQPPSSPELDSLAEAIRELQKDNEETSLDELLALNSSSSGARPKICMHKDGVEWLIKFAAPSDLQDIGPLEYAYHLMAQKAGLSVPQARLFPSLKGPGYFGVQRFDRQGESRLHVHSVSGLVHADHRLPSLDYATLMKITLSLTKDARECEKLLRQAVFNVLSHNRDDHAKNFSFLMDEKGAWQLAPAYDLTYSSGPFGEHATTVMKEGKRPTLAQLLKLAEVGGISRLKALTIIDEVKNALSEWETVAKEVGARLSSIKTVQAALRRVSKEAGT